MGRGTLRNCNQKRDRNVMFLSSSSKVSAHWYVRFFAVLGLGRQAQLGALQ